ncbi:MAG: hypothetical protein NTV80_12195 [Verrucomicrobia bacterium]|nr:hypothetical protein [Verrucomicrobiota bacterium]
MSWREFGSDGGSGPQRIQGPPFAQAVVDSLSMLDSCQPTWVQTSFDGSNGNDGAPGEVSLAQLDNAISGTSANTNGVSTLDTSFSDPDMEMLRQAYNNLVLTLRR